MASLVLAWIYIRRGQFFDSLDIEVMAIFHSGNWLTPYHGHLSILPVALDKILYTTVGNSVTWPYAVLALIVYLAVPACLYWDYRDRVAPILAAFAAVAVIWSWPTQDNLRFNFMMNFYIPVIAYLVARRLIDRGTRRGDAWSAVAITLGLCSSTVGVVVLVGIVAELIARRTPRRILWYLPSTVLWLVWYLTMGDSSSIEVGAFFRYLWQTTVAIFSGFTLGWRPGAAVAAGALVALVVVAHRRWRTIGPRAVGVMAALAAFIGSTAFARAGEANVTTPDSPRYVWLGGLLIILIVLECFTGRRVSWRTVGVAALLTAMGAVAMFSDLRINRTWFYYSTDFIVPRLLVFETLPLTDANADDRLLYGSMSTRADYKGMVDHLGSPLEQTGFADRGTWSKLAEADHSLVAGLAIVPNRTGSPPECATGWAEPRDRTDRGDAIVDPATSVLVDPGPDRVARLRVRRLAPDFGRGAPAWWTVRGRPLVVDFPVDDDPRPWILRLDGPDATLSVCPD